jgi:branched-chain amino acid transport system ATP-binding protein
VIRESPIVEVKMISKRFGGLTALEEVSLSFKRGSIHGVIGPNGAGKTTLLNVLSGLERPSSGFIEVKGVNVTGWPAHRIVTRARVARTFQTVRFFTSMTVRENVYVAARCAAARAKATHLTDELIDRLDLRGVAEKMAVSLSYGLQRRVELARTLATQPLVMLLDEPAAGLSQSERQHLAEILRETRDTGVSIVLVEHHMDLVHAVCEECSVLDFGQVICSGATSDVMTDERVLEAYLGGPVDIMGPNLPSEQDRG